jgi:hypothetical protein
VAARPSLASSLPTRLPSMREPLAWRAQPLFWSEKPRLTRSGQAGFSFEAGFLSARPRDLAALQRPMTDREREPAGKLGLRDCPRNSVASATITKPSASAHPACGGHGAMRRERFRQTRPRPRRPTSRPRCLGGIQLL